MEIANKLENHYRDMQDMEFTIELFLRLLRELLTFILFIDIFKSGYDFFHGVAFTRNPSTGAKGIYGEYLINAQGEDVVAGIRTP